MLSSALMFYADITVQFLVAYAATVLAFVAVLAGILPAGEPSE